MRGFGQRAGGLRRPVTAGVVLLVGCAALVGGASGASATTGAAGLSPPRQSVPKTALAPFLGTFKSTAHGRGIISALMYTRSTYGSQPWANGGLEVYAYDSKGNVSSYLATVYQYRWTGKMMQMELITVGTSPVVFGRMQLRPGAAHTLVGALSTSGSSTTVTLRRTTASSPGTAPVSGAPAVGGA
jgi:hypothetical protein